MEKEMDIDTGLNIARQLKNHYRAFEKLEEFLRLVANSQGLLGEHERKAAKLQESIKDLERKEAECRTTVEGEILKLHAERDTARSSMEEARKVHGEEMKRLGEEKAEAERILKKVSKDLESIRQRVG